MAGGRLMIAKGGVPPPYYSGAEISQRYATNIGQQTQGMDRPCWKIPCAKWTSIGLSLSPWEKSEILSEYRPKRCIPALRLNMDQDKNPKIISAIAGTRVGPGHSHVSHFIWSTLPSTTVIGVTYEYSLLVVEGPCLLVFGVAFLQACSHGETCPTFWLLATFKKSGKSFLTMIVGLYFCIFWDLWL